MQIRSCVTWFSDMFINKLKIKLHVNSFLQNGFKYKKNSQLLLKKVSNVLFARKKTRRPLGRLRAKIVIVGSSK